MIVTNLDFALEAALSKTWPEAHHQLCTWHINQNLNRKLSSKLGPNFKDFTKRFNKLIYARDPTEYERTWSEICDEYPEAVVRYLETYNSRREKWSDAWTNQTFNLGIRSTQGAEAMNRVVKRHLSSRADLRTLVEHINEV